MISTSKSDTSSSRVFGEGAKATTVVVGKVTDTKRTVTGGGGECRGDLGEVIAAELGNMDQVADDRGDRDGEVRLLRLALVRSAAGC
jgi:hypothetical protein